MRPPPELSFLQAEQAQHENSPQHYYCLGKRIDMWLHGSFSAFKEYGASFSPYTKGTGLGKSVQDD